MVQGSLPEPSRFLTFFLPCHYWLCSSHSCTMNGYSVVKVQKTMLRNSAERSLKVHSAPRLTPSLSASPLLIYRAAFCGDFHPPQAMSEARLTFGSCPTLVAPKCRQSCGLRPSISIARPSCPTRSLI